MSNTILIKKSTTPGAVPTTGQVAFGELAVNTYDGRLFTKIDTGTPEVFELTQNQPITVIGNVTGTSTNGVGNTTIDLTLSNTGVAAGTYGGTSNASTNVGVFTVDQYGRITSASNTTISTSSLANGTANIQVYHDGTINLNPEGTSNVAVFSATGEYLTGLLSVTGNITGGNIDTSGLVTVIGNITGGNLNTGGVVSATGTITGGNVVTSGTVSATGNLDAGNVNTGGVISATGTITGGNVATEGTVSANGNITGGNLTTVGLVSSGTASVTGNAVVGNILTDGYYYANGAPVDFQQPAGSNTQIQFNSDGDFGATSAFTFDTATNTLTVDTLTVNNQQIAAAPGNYVELYSDNYTQLNYNNETWVWLNAGGVNFETPNGTANFNNDGNLSVSGDITGSNVVVTSLGDEQIAISSNGRLVGGIDLKWEFANASLWTTGLKSNGVISTSGTVVAYGNITGGNLLTLGNAEVGGIKTDNYMYANGSPVDFQQAAGSNTQIQFNNNNDFGASSNFTFDSVLNQLNLTGTASISGNATIDSVLVENGNISGGANGIQLYSTDYSQLNYNNETWVWADSNGIGFETPGGIAQMYNTGSWYLPLDLEVGGNIANALSVTASGNVLGSNVNADLNVVTPNVVGLTGLTLSTGSNANINLDPDGTGNVVVGVTWINRVKDPVQDQDVATKNYVDNMVAAGIDIHTGAVADAESNLDATYTGGGTTPTWTDIANNTTLSTGLAHGLMVNDVVVFDTTTNGITAGVPYFVFSVPSATSITLADNYNGEVLTTLTNGSINLSSAANTGVGATLASNTNGPLILDQYTAQLNDRILVIGQTNATENGIYVVTQVGVADPGGSPWILTRATDGDKYGQGNSTTLGQGAYFFITGGIDRGESYVCNTSGTIVFGTTEITFAEFSKVTPIQAGNGLSYTNGGTILNVNVDNITTAITGGNVVVKASAQLTTPNIGDATGLSLSVTGNITGGNVNTNGTLSVGGNIDAANFNTSGIVSANGNIIGGNISTDGVVTVLGNITGGNITTEGLANVATLLVTGTASVTGNIDSTSVTTGTLTIEGGLGVTGNIYGGSLYSGGDPVLTVNSVIDGGTY